MKFRLRNKKPDACHTGLFWIKSQRIDWHYKRKGCAGGSLARSRAKLPQHSRSDVRLNRKSVIFLILAFMNR
jgi:hypothetical protein